MAQKLIFLSFGIIFVAILINIGSTEASEIAWDGGGATNYASDSDNWAGDVAPGLNDTAIFDSTSQKSCLWDLPLIESINIYDNYTGTLSQQGDLHITKFLNISKYSKFYTNGFNLTAEQINIDGNKQFNPPLDHSGKGELVCNASTIINCGKGFGHDLRGILTCVGNKTNPVIITGNEWTCVGLIVQARYTFFLNPGLIRFYVNFLYLENCVLDFEGTNGYLYLMGCPVNPKLKNVTFKNYHQTRFAALRISGPHFIRDGENIVFENNYRDIYLESSSDEGNATLQFINSSFDFNKVLLHDSTWVASKNHNGVLGDYKVMAAENVSINGTYIWNRPPTNLTHNIDEYDRLDVLKGTLIINENLTIHSITVRNNAKLKINSSTLTIKDGEFKYLNTDAFYLDPDGKLELINVETNFISTIVRENASIKAKYSILSLTNGSLLNNGIIELAHSTLNIVNGSFSGNPVVYTDSESKMICLWYLSIKTMDKRTGEEISYAEIRITGHDGEVWNYSTNEGGFITFLLPAMFENSKGKIYYTYNITIRVEGYNTVFRNITLKNSTHLEITLVPTTANSNSNGTWNIPMKAAFITILLVVIVSILFAKKKIKKLISWAIVKWRY